MEMKILKVAKPGLFTTIQDEGRFGFQRYGIPVSGAMDVLSLITANLLVNNSIFEACLEITLLGPELEVLNEGQIAIAGADLSPSLNRDSISCFETIQVRRGDVLSFGRPLSGCRAYLAVRGGINVPSVMGSKSTYVRGGFGGHEGRKLEKGDIINTRTQPLLQPGFRLSRECVPQYYDDTTVEVISGPQQDFFTDEELEIFLSSTYTISIESDRMGYRLEGPRVKQKDSMVMISDATPVGAVQVPPSGKPIIVMRDAQTTGGYPKIAVLTTPDIPLVGQARPNDTIRFSRISLVKATEKLLAFAKKIRQIENGLELKR